MNLKDAIAQEAKEILTEWLEEVECARPFIACSPSAFPSMARADSAIWSSRFFTPHANPHNPVLNAKSSYHPADNTAPDLLRFAYTVSNLPVVVTEGRNYVVAQIQVKLDPRDAARASQEILNLADHEHRWTLPLPTTLVEGTMFSTNPFVHPMSLATWHRRLDGGVRGGSLWFLGYKKIEQLLGFQAASDWFEEKFRTP